VVAQGEEEGLSAGQDNEEARENKVHLVR